MSTGLFRAVRIKRAGTSGKFDPGTRGNIFAQNRWPSGTLSVDGMLHKP